MAFTYDHPRPSVTVDTVIFWQQPRQTKVLLIKRSSDPYKDKWAFPGGFIEMDETLEASALRELEEETGLTNIKLEQLGAYGDPDRDPRGRVISVAFMGVISGSEPKAKAASDAAEAEWMDVEELPALAFDHDKIMKAALGRLRSRNTSGESSQH
jgi:8-oxo-dGTP diphosphatase